MIKKYLVCVLVLSASAAAWSAPATSKRVDLSHKTPIVGNVLEINQTPTADVRRPDPSRSLDVIGEQFVAGTTYYDYQHNGSAGRMIGVDPAGFVHLTWMNATVEDLTLRDAYYNCWDPNTSNWQELIPAGGVAANTVRAGYTTIATLDNGFAFPSFHSTVPGGAVLSTHASIDFTGCAGAFTPFGFGPFGAGQNIWPKIARDGDSPTVLHGVSTSDAATDQAILYWRGEAVYDGPFGIEIVFATFSTGDQYQQLGTTETISPDVAASPISDRVAVVFNQARDAGGVSQLNNNLMLVISEDGGENFAPPVDLTDWIEPDFGCASGDTLACNNDTLRTYNCLDVEFDYNDNLHVAFTTRTYFEVGYPGQGEGPIGFINMSSIWHWGEDTDEFSNIANYPGFATFANGDSLLADNAWQLPIQRPSMSFDTSTGMLYCSYIYHDSTQYNANYFMSADIMLTASCNNGRTWYEPINLTSTPTEIAAACGECLHERDQTLAPLVSYVGDEGYLHLSYVLDLDVGGVPQTEGCTTLNNVYYQRIALSDLVWGVMQDWTAGPTLHVDGRQAVGTGPMPFDPDNPCGTPAGDERNGIPTAFQLFQNYPNPFNPMTNIQFDLVSSSKVSLKVFNVLGEVVATLVDGEALSAGAHNYSFDGANMASGVYMYRLEANGISSTRKMVLLK